MFEDASSAWIAIVSLCPAGAWNVPVHVDIEQAKSSGALLFTITAMVAVFPGMTFGNRFLMAACAGAPLAGIWMEKLTVPKPAGPGLIGPAAGVGEAPGTRARVPLLDPPPPQPVQMANDNAIVTIGRPVSRIAIIGFSLDRIGVLFLVAPNQGAVDVP
jgi:hypothetical protein